MAKFGKFRFAVVLAFLSISDISQAANNVTTFAKPAVRDAWADIAGAPDLVDPGNAFASAGWLNSSVPPARQFFNWVLNYDSNAVRYFSQRGIVDFDIQETYQQGAVVQFGNSIYQSLTNNNVGHTPVLTGSANWAGLSIAANSTFAAPLTIFAPSSGATFVARGVVGNTAFTGNSPFTTLIGLASTSTTSYTGIDFSDTSTPKVRIGATFSALGSSLVLGTSNNYTAGITNSAVTIGPTGGVTINAPVTALTVNGGVAFNAPASGATLAVTGRLSANIFTLTDGNVVSAYQTGTNTSFWGTVSNHPMHFMTNSVDLGSFGIAGGLLLGPGVSDQGPGTINANAYFIGNANLVTTVESFATTAANNAQSAAISTSEAFTSASVSGLAPLASPGLTGNPTAPTAAPGTNTAQLATTAFVQSAVNAPASVTSPGFQKLPSGIIFEWGQNGCQSGSPGTTVSFPLTFPHAVFSVTATAFGQNSNTITVLSQSASSFSCINAVSGASTNWFAVGF